MARMTTVREDLDCIAFVGKCAEQFAANPQLSTYGDLTPGSLLGLRWGLGNDCVLVVKLDENFTHVNFQQAVKRQGF